MAFLKTYRRLLARETQRWTYPAVIAFLAMTACASPPALAGSGYIDLTRDGDQDKTKYYVIFAARSIKVSDLSLGHAFVGVGIEDYDSNASSYVAYGLYPDQKGLKTFLGQVPGAVLQETISKSPEVIDGKTSGNSPFNASETFIVRVDQFNYMWLKGKLEADSLASSGSISPPIPYEKLTNDCVSYIEDVAKRIGLDTPDRTSNTPGTWLPDWFVAAMRNMYTTSQVLGLPDGRTWSGIVYRGVPHGQGDILSFGQPDGSLFTGQMKFGQYVRGLLSNPKVGDFQGDFENGVFKNGTVEFVKGPSYSGTFRDGHPADILITFKDGSTLAGNYAMEGAGPSPGAGSKEILHSGQIKYGTFTRNGGQTFTGTFRDYKFDLGTLTDKSGVRFEGKFQDSHAVYGTVADPSGASYTGTFDSLGHFRHGIITTPDKTTFEGDYAGQKPTEGIITTASGTKFWGKIGDANMEGVWLTPQGDKVMGKEIAGILSGYFVWHTGESYVGTLNSNGSLNNGTLIWIDGSSFSVHNGHADAPPAAPAPPTPPVIQLPPIQFPIQNPNDCCTMKPISTDDDN
jgi:hypothetical protein